MEKRGLRTSDTRCWQAGYGTPGHRFLFPCCSPVLLIPGFSLTVLFVFLKSVFRTLLSFFFLLLLLLFSSFFLFLWHVGRASRFHCLFFFSLLLCFDDRSTSGSPGSLRVSCRVLKTGGEEGPATAGIICLGDPQSSFLNRVHRFFVY